MLLLDAQQGVQFDHIIEHTELYDHGETSRKAFERDKALLRQLGVEINTEIDRSSGATRYRIRPEDYFLPDMELSESERLALQLAASMVRLDEAWDEQAMTKLGSTGPEVAATAPPYAIAEIPALESLPVLYGAMRDRAPVEFSYSGRGRVVNGYVLFYRDGNWYFAGDTDSDVKVFRVDRIEGSVKAGIAAAYQIPNDFDPELVMPRDPLLIGDSETLEALVWVDARIANRVVRIRGAENVRERRADGSVVVMVPVRNRDAFRSWVLGLRDHAVVLAPRDLRDDVVEWLEAIVGVS